MEGEKSGRRRADRRARRAAVPDPRNFSAALERALSVLLNANGGEGVAWLSAVEISNFLRDRYGISSHWKTIETQLSNARNLAARRKRDGRWQFRIMHAGETHLSGAEHSVIVVDPAKAVQAVASFHIQLAGLKGQVRICDPYLDGATIEHLSSCARGTQIRFLTKNIQNSAAVRRLLSAASTQGIAIEVRTAAATAPLHDRYIIDNSSMLILGTSLNGFGKKQCFVIIVGPDIRETMTSTFDSLWASAQLWS